MRQGQAWKLSLPTLGKLSWRASGGQAKAGPVAAQQAYRAGVVDAGTRARGWWSWCQARVQLAGSLEVCCLPIAAFLACRGRHLDWQAGWEAHRWWLRATASTAGGSGARARPAAPATNPCCRRRPGPSHGSWTPPGWSRCASWPCRSGIGVSLLRVAGCSSPAGACGLLQSWTPLDCPVAAAQPPGSVHSCVGAALP